MNAEHGPISPEKVDFPKAPERKAERDHGREEEPLAAEQLEEGEARAEVQEALHDAQESAQEEQAPAPGNARPQYVVSNKQKERAFNKTMQTAQREMSPGSKAFSKFIHNPAIEATSEIAGRTVARPTSILYGSFCAFVLLSGVYLLAKHNGFRLSGFEFIGLFAIGWLIGLLADFLRHMITGKE